MGIIITTILQNNLPGVTYGSIFSISGWQPPSTWFRWALRHFHPQYKNGHLQQDCLGKKNITLPRQIIKNMTHLTQLQMHQSQSPPLFLRQNKHSNQKKQGCQQIIAKKNVQFCLKKKHCKQMRSFGIGPIVLDWQKTIHDLHLTLIPIYPFCIQPFISPLGSLTGSITIAIRKHPAVMAQRSHTDRPWKSWWFPGGDGLFVPRGYVLRNIHVVSIYIDLEYIHLSIHQTINCSCTSLYIKVSSSISALLQRF